MSIKTIAELKAEALVIKTNEQPDTNTHLVVGGFAQDVVDTLESLDGANQKKNSTLITKSSSDTWTSIFALPYDNFRLKFSSYHATVPTELSGNATSTEYEVQRVGRNGLIFQSGSNKWAFTSDGGARKDASVVDLVAYLANYYTKAESNALYPKLTVGKNLFNKNASGIIDGKYLTTAGVENTNASFFISDYIPILPSTAYISNKFNIGGAFCCFYDSSKTLISGASVNTAGFTSPSNAYYVRMSGTVADKAAQQLELGTVATFYESYYNAITEPNVPLSIARKLDIDTLINSTPQFPRFATGKNLFNYADSGVKRGYYLLATNVENANSSYSITGYIPVIAGQVLRCNKSVGGGAYNMFYDAFKNPILAFNSGTSPAAPTGAAYVRYSLSVTAAESISAAQAQVEVNSTSTAYEAYYSYLLDAALPPTIARKTDLIPYVQKITGKNLFNPADADIMVGYYISSTGTNNANGYGYNITGFIPISAGQTLKANWSMANTYAALYDANKNYIATTAVNANSIVWQTGAVYARFSYNVATVNNQVEVGTVSTAFEEFTEYQPLAQVKAQVHDRDIQPILPAKMYFAKGKESCLYYENVLLKNMNDPTTLFVNKGFNYNRLCQLNFAAAATNQTMPLQVLRSLKKGLLKSITYNVKDPATNNGKTVNVLFIGDSFTDIGTYVKEVKTLMAVDGVTVNLLGTNGNSTFKAEGLSGGTIADTLLNTSRGVAKLVQVTGMTTLPSSDYPGTFYSDSNGNQWLIRGGKISGGSGHIRVTKTSGAVIGDFATFPSSGTLTKIDGAREGDATISYSTPTDAYHNPFINPSTGLLDMAYYLSSNSFANPEIINIQFTWNDLATWLSDASIAAVVANFKTAVDHIHSVLASTKIVLSIEPFGSVNGNLDWNGKKYSVLRFAELMIAQFETDVNYSSFVIVAPSYAFVDLVYGYSSSTATPCSRYAITEQSGGDGTHPGTGMKQIADCLFQIFHNVI